MRKRHFLAAAAVLAVCMALLSAPVTAFATGPGDDYGDIDIAYELEHKINDCKRFSEASQRIIANAIADGKVFSSIIEEVCYPSAIVLRHLKNRSPYISLHRVEDIEILSAPHKQIYP